MTVGENGFGPPGSRRGAFSVGDTGGAIIARDHREFIDATRALAADGEKRQAMRVAARQRALELSWDRIFDDVYRAYEATMARPRRIAGAMVMNAGGVATPSG